MALLLEVSRYFISDVEITEHQFSWNVTENLSAYYEFPYLQPTFA